MLAPHGHPPPPRKPKTSSPTTSRRSPAGPRCDNRPPMTGRTQGKDGRFRVLPLAAMPSCRYLRWPVTAWVPWAPFDPFHPRSITGWGPPRDPLELAGVAVFVQRLLWTGRQDRPTAARWSFWAFVRADPERPLCFACPRTTSAIGARRRTACWLPGRSSFPWSWLPARRACR